MREAVPGATTVLVVGDPTDARLRHAVATASPMPVARTVARDPIVVPVRYDGPDLHSVAERCRLDVDEVVERHSRPTYTAAFGGFVPGFAYLTGLDASLRVPRRDTPRTSVPAGSVAIAERFTAVYPSATPGGWHIVGSTALTLFDATRTPPAFIRPGDAVRFEPQ